MNRISALIVAAAALAATASYAGDITIDTTPFSASRSRAEVQAELAQFKAAGPNVWSTQYNQLAQFVPQRSRAAVRAEYLASRAQVAAFTAEDSGSAWLARGRTAHAGTRVAAQ